MKAVTNTQVVILAGGLGTRLRPATEQVPKSMISIGDKPYLWYQLKYLADQGFDKILLLTGYLGEQIREYFKDGRAMDLGINYSQEPSPLGTGGALRYACDLLEDEFLLIFGDSFLPEDYRSALQCFKRSGKMGLMTVCDNSKNDTSVPGNVVLSKDTSIVIEYNKKNSASTTRFVEAGVLAFRKGVVDLLEGQQPSLEEQLYPKLIGQQEMAAFLCQQRFYDIGTPDRLHHIKEYFA